MARSPFDISRPLKAFAGDRRLIGILIFGALFLAGATWLRANPHHNPFAPLDLRQPVGLATKMKLLDITENRGSCRAVLARSEVKFETLTPTGQGPCALLDRTKTPDAPLSPSSPEFTCPVAAGLQVWLNNGLQEAAQAHLGSRVKRLEHLGTVSCRRVNGAQTGPWSEHAKGNAIDIRAFILDDGRRIDILSDWGQDARGQFLKAARDSACESFLTVLSPDFNAAHADHFHLDQGTRWNSVCR